MRQLILFEKKKKRWMPNLRQQTRRSAVWADLTKQVTNSSQKGLLICTSKLQVHCQFYKLCTSALVFL